MTEQRPDPYASVAETHSAVVFFLGDKAYKAKKPVALGFLDFSTPEARRVACEREVQLNRRLAPDVYLGVADVIGVDGDVCDHLVVMRRMPSERRLSWCLERGEDVDDALRQVARDVARLHASSLPEALDVEVASADRLAARWADSFHTVDEYAGSIFPAATVTRCERLVDRYLTGRRRLFDQRISDGTVRDGHGDLQADDIFVLDDGPRVLDCLEFADELRCCDSLDDVSFLAMDLERLGRPDLARRFLAWHREFTGDTWPASLAHHYVAYRAHVRAKVEAIRSTQGAGDAAARATQLLELCHAHLEAARVQLILVGGPPGTGKTTLSDALASTLPVVVVRSDEVREQAQDGPVGFGEGRYSRDAVESNYEKMFHQATELLELGESVVLDASWSSAARRQLARAVADDTSSEIVEFRCDAPPDVAIERVRNRLATGRDRSEATPSVAAAMAHGFDPWPEATVLDTTQPIETCVERASRALAAHEA